MSFSPITSSPAWGTPKSEIVSQPATPPSPSGIAVFAQDRSAMLADTLECKAIDTSGINKPLAGWVTYTGGGGGGSTRPTSGMIYPRGTC